MKQIKMLHSAYIIIHSPCGCKDEVHSNSPKCYTNIHYLIIDGLDQ